MSLRLPIVLLVVGVSTGFYAHAEQDALAFLYSPSVSAELDPLVDRIRIHASNAEFELSLTLSQTLLEQLEHLKIDQPVLYGQLVVNHGIIQSASQDYDLGLSVIDEGLELMEQRTNPFDEMLINAIMAKGLTELVSGKSEEAEDTFRHAQHITHRHGGVYSKDQLPIVNYVTRALLQQGRAYQADKQQLFGLRVSEHSYGPDSLELLPTLARLGNYFSSRGGTIPVMTSSELRLERDLMFKHALNMYSRSVEIIEQNFGENDLRLVQPLRGLASTRVLQITNRKHAEKALERSLDIVRSNPDSDLSDHAQALIDLGDLYIVTSDDRAAEIYLNAWELLQESPETQEIANIAFAEPVRLLPKGFPVIYLERKPDLALPGSELFVDLEFTVSEKGKVTGAKVLDRNVPNEEVRLLRTQVRNTRFRPRIVEAEIVETQGLLLHQSYRLLETTAQQYAVSDEETNKETGKEVSQDDADDIDTNIEDAPVGIDDIQENLVESPEGSEEFTGSAEPNL